jgi:WD40 repeat protein
VISAGYDKVIRIWDVGTAQTVRSIEEHWPQGRAGEIYAIVLSPDGKLLAVGGYMDTACPSPGCGDIRLYQVASGALQGVLSGHSNIILSLAFSADGTRLASSSPDRTTRVWDVVEQRELARFAFPGTEGRASKVAFLGDNRHVVTVSDRPLVHVYELGRERPVATLTANEELHAIAVSDDSRYIAAGGMSGKIHVWKWPSREFLELPGNGARVSTIAFGHKSSASEVVASSSNAPYTSRVFDVTTGEMLIEHAAHDNTVTASAYSSDGTRIATAGGNDWSIYVWSAIAPAVGRRLGGGGKIVHAVGLLRNHARALAGAALST